jgi:hypothetical protein
MTELFFPENGDRWEAQGILVPRHAMIPFETSLMASEPLLLMWKVKRLSVLQLTRSQRVLTGVRSDDTTEFLVMEFPVFII